MKSEDAKALKYSLWCICFHLIVMFYVQFLVISCFLSYTHQCCGLTEGGEKREGDRGEGKGKGAERGGKVHLGDSPHSKTLDPPLEMCATDVAVVQLFGIASNEFFIFTIFSKILDKAV